MKKNIALFLIICLICLYFTGCQARNDGIEIYNKNATVFDNVYIEIKDGYFYDRHEKFTVDENTIAVTIYFSTEDDEWD